MCVPAATLADGNYKAALTIHNQTSRRLLAATPSSLANHSSTALQTVASATRSLTPPATSPPTFPDNRSEFELGQAQTNACAAGFSRLSSKAKCETAATQFGLVFQGSEEAPAYPKGCYVYPGEGVYFNLHKTGASEQDSKPICANNNFVSEQPSAGIPSLAPAAVMSKRPKLPLLFKSCRCAFAGHFIRCKADTNICPSGSVALSIVPECRRASKELLCTYEDQQNTDLLPKGCYIDESGAQYACYFNFGANGSPLSTASPICGNLYA